MEEEKYKKKDVIDGKKNSNNDKSLNNQYIDK
jgi:hypothetical protein